MKKTLIRGKPHEQLKRNSHSGIAYMYGHNHILHVYVLPRVG